jgi:histidinol dehydrogenase
MMQIIKYPNRKDWEKLCIRPHISEENLNDLVKNIFEEISSKGDEVLFKYTQKFDKVVLNDLRVNEKEIKEAINLVSDDLKKAIDIAKQNI